MRRRRGSGLNHVSYEVNGHGDFVCELAESFGDTCSAYAMSHEYDLVVMRDIGEEREERTVIMVELEDGVSVGEVDAGTGEVDGGGFESVGDKKSCEFIPTPSTVAGSMNEYKVNYGLITTVSSHCSFSLFIRLKLSLVHLI